jgi:hypothetical protein
MVTVQITLQLETMSNAAAAAARENMTFDQYVEWRLTAVEQVSNAVNFVGTPMSGDENPEQVARALFKIALDQQAEEAADDYHVEARPYLIEELYTRHFNGKPWTSWTVGNRIQLGRQFKKLVDAQPQGGQQIEDGRQMRIEFVGHTKQNQTRYRTMRVG